MYSTLVGRRLIVAARAVHPEERHQPVHEAGLQVAGDTEPAADCKSPDGGAAAQGDAALLQPPGSTTHHSYCCCCGEASWQLPVADVALAAQHVLILGLRVMRIKPVCLLVQVLAFTRNANDSIWYSLIKVLGCATIWRHRSLLLRLCVATAILLKLLGDGRIRRVGEQGSSGSRLTLAWRGLRRASKMHLCIIARKSFR